MLDSEGRVMPDSEERAMSDSEGRVMPDREERVMPDSEAQGGSSPLLSVSPPSSVTVTNL